MNISFNVLNNLINVCSYEIGRLLNCILILQETACFAMKLGQPCIVCTLKQINETDYIRGPCTSPLLKNIPRFDLIFFPKLMKQVFQFINSLS